jgi:amidase
MALRCDHGGSICIPASSCGIVGLKPTWGLVPYTGIISLEVTIDHAWPMTKTLRDAAVLMDILARYDGLDDRQPYMLKVGDIKFVEGVDEALKAEKPLPGMNVGVPIEGFECEVQDPIVTKLVESVAEDLESLGAEVKKFSMQSHKYPRTSG